MNINLLKTKECLQWTEDMYHHTGDMEITVLDKNTLSYLDIESELCILKFENDSIQFVGEDEVYNFEEFLLQRLLGDERTVEQCLNEIDLDF